MIFLQFKQSVTTGPGTGTTSDHLIEIIVMLLVAFILGFLLRLLLNGRYKKQVRDLNDENTQLKMDMAKLQHEEENKIDVKSMQAKIDHLERTRRVLQNDLELCRNETSKLKAMAQAVQAPTKEEPVKKKTPKVESIKSEPSPIVAKAMSPKIKTDKDNLTKIEGIGPKIQEHLNNGGITTFEELQDAPITKLQEILDAAGPLYKVHDPGTWPEQAGYAVRGEWIALSKWQDDLKGGKRV